MNGMKRSVRLLVISLVSLAFTPVPSVAQGFWRKIGSVVRSAAPTVTFPAIQQVTGVTVGAGAGGVSTEKWNLVVRNGVRIKAVANIFVYEKMVARLGPGAIAVDDRKSQLHGERIPVMAFYYEDVGGGAPGRFIGLAWGRASFYPNSPSTQPLTFEIGDILKPDGQRLHYGYGGETFPIPMADLREVIVHLPRKWIGGTTGLQIGNVSLFTARVSVNGHTIATLPAGGYSYREWEVIGYGTVRSVQVEYLQENGVGPDGKTQYLLIGSVLDVPLYLSPSGIEGRQLIIGPPSYGAWTY